MNKEIESLQTFLNSNTKFIISTHESPDPDGLGAELAFVEFLEKEFSKECLIINSDPIPEKYEFMDPEKKINVLSPDYKIPKNISDYSLFILDTNDYYNIGTLYSSIKNDIQNVYIIDHHESDLDLIEDNYIKATASSACEIIYTIFKEYNFKPSKNVAKALYSGILFDTGSFHYPKTTVLTFNTVADLVELGADPFELYENIYENNSIGNFILTAYMYSEMKVLFDGKLIVMKLTPEMIKGTGALFSEGEQKINLPLTIKGVQASMLIKQDIDGPVKISMRTKGDLDVAELAVKKGGGGHKNAAGYKSNNSFEQAYEDAISEISKFFL